MIKIIVAALLILVTLILPANSTNVQYKELGGKTKEVSGLFTNKDCFAISIQGKVVKRNFGENGVSLSGFVVEAKDGSRSFVNVQIPDDLSMVELEYVNQGLQTLIRRGRTFHGDVRACGAAGRVLMLESVR